MNEQVKQEILSYILEKTGAAAAHVLLSTSSIPCDQEKDGNGCLTEHLMTTFAYGIEPEYLPGLMEQLKTEAIIKVSPEDDD